MYYTVWYRRKWNLSVLYGLVEAKVEFQCIIRFGTGENGIFSVLYGLVQAKMEFECIIRFGTGENGM